MKFFDKIIELFKSLTKKEFTLGDILGSGMVH